VGGGNYARFWKDYSPVFIGVLAIFQGCRGLTGFARTARVMYGDKRTGDSRFARFARNDSQKSKSKSKGKGKGKRQRQSQEQERIRGSFPLATLEGQDGGEKQTTTTAKASDAVGLAEEDA
jgi:hypothetical protein